MSSMPTISILTAALQPLPEHPVTPSLLIIQVPQSLFPSVHILIYHSRHLVANALHSALWAVPLHVLCKTSHLLTVFPPVRWPLRAMGEKAHACSTYALQLRLSFSARQPFYGTCQFPVRAPSCSPQWIKPSPHSCLLYVSWNDFLAVRAWWMAYHLPSCLWVSPLDSFLIEILQSINCSSSNSMQTFLQNFPSQLLVDHHWGDGLICRFLQGHFVSLPFLSDPNDNNPSGSLTVLMYSRAWGWHEPRELHCPPHKDWLRGGHLLQGGFGRFPIFPKEHWGRNLSPSG